MKIKPLLRELRIGADVAENDSQLDAYFVETSTFWDVVGDSSDVVLGPKGSGKSAISRRLTDGNVGIPELRDVDVIPAFNLQGGVFFRRLANEIVAVDESQMRLAWTAYMLSLVGNHLVSTYEAVVDCSRIRQFLTDAGFLFLENRPRSVWAKVVLTIRRSTPSRVDAGVQLDEAGNPRFVTGLEFDQDDEERDPAWQVDWEVLLEEELAVLGKIGRRCWLVFDRLDEAFPHDRHLERSALRGLLRAHMDVSTHSSALRTKLFLRTDLLDRITAKEGFVNATHLRTQRIRWDQKTLVDLVARRVVESDGIRRQFDLDRAALNSDQGRLEICGVVIPAYLEAQDVFGWLVQRTSDASDEPNPRNVLTLLREARSRQLQICDRDDPDFSRYGSLIGGPAMREALKSLSTIRLEDTLFAEYNHLRPWIEKLRGRFISYMPAELSRVLGLEADPETYDRVVTDFKYAGLMRQSPRGKFSIPVLYRAALHLQENRPKGAESAPARVVRITGPDAAATESSARADATLANYKKTLRAFGAPELTTKQFNLFFNFVAEELIAHPGGRITKLQRGVRDKCADTGLKLTRGQVDFITKNVLLYSGYDSKAATGHTAEGLAKAYHQRLVKLLRRSYIRLDATGEAQLATWIVGHPVEPVPEPVDA